MSSDEFDIAATLGPHDPAQGTADPDLTALRAKVDAHIAADPSADDAAANVVMLRGRRTWWITGSAAAAVSLLAAGTLAGVIFSGGEAPIIAATADAGLASVNAAPNIGSPSGPMVSMGGRQAAVGEQLGAADARISYWPGFNTTLEPGPDLPNESGTATGYRLGGENIDQTALAQRLADVFAVNGTPQLQDYGIVVGDPNGTAPQVWVNNDGQVSWSFSDPTRDPWACALVEPVEPMDSDNVVPGSDGCAQTEMMSTQDAQTQAEEILTALGVATAPDSSVGIEWETSMDGVLTTATAWQTIDGARTQLSWTFNFDAQGPLWVSGFAAGLEMIPDYPIIGARNTLTRSQIPRWAAFGPNPTDSMLQPVSSARAGDEDTTEPLPIAPLEDRAVTVRWDPAVAVAAELTLAQYWAPDGTFFLLPAYEFQTDNDRGVWTIIAVGESAVSFTSGP
ncbi:MAG: hypothetical protein ACYYNF_09560 [Actinomycetes bacterium]